MCACRHAAGMTVVYKLQQYPLLLSSTSLTQVQVAKATLSDETAMLDTFNGEGQRSQHPGSLVDPFEGSTRDKFLVAAAAAPRFLLLDFR